MEISTTKLISLILGLIGLIALPIGGLWALNTLTPLDLEYSLLNWSAVLFTQLYLQIVLKASFASTRHESKNKSK
jgi:hypothetical protein